MNKDDFPFTSDEDFLLLQSYVRHPGEFNKIAESFSGRRTADRLQKRWEELNENMLPDQLDVFDHFKKAENQYKPEKYYYGQEYEYETPNIEDILSCYNDVPSLAQKTEGFEINYSSNPEDECSDLNEHTLGTYFDAKSVLDIITRSLQETISDDHVREMLLRDYRLTLYIEGQKLAVHDLTRRITFINDKLQPEVAEKECQHILAFYNKVMNFVKHKAASYCQHSNMRMTPSGLLLDLAQILSYMSRVHWPTQNFKPYVYKLKQECDIAYISTCAAILNYLEPAGLQKYDRFIDAVIMYDPEEKLDGQLLALPQTYVRQRRYQMKQNIQQMPQFSPQ
ncbi:hypothetical protein TVAG_426600 [Trichomonas vaginalis G3]|uniref:Myb-like domain-containing protein n=1 Tax=Trichomonas vaginalis (strain ATCC PRA-98 / G3) TaxID=412133 RepID=A2DYS6_TRIV3|nr:Myb-like DNA-binding domain family [Trichomonas vaginalis G3]EAY14466.1 hypothetical protein TVAG_426600 [Trichomonas vaginalis G3]KAI5519646.1 Myb-like DNA-binding domain family [Trichomonas vaginalis G3]|eukprot:XP_001326689.1 hypothetical protein [Trichomonas vaginalis G3]